MRSSVASFALALALAPAAGAAAPPVVAPATSAASATAAPAHGTAAAAPTSPTAAPAGLYAGPTSCGTSNCHGGVLPRKTFAVRQDEYFIWMKRDAHAKAYEALFNPRSLVIARNLGLGKPSGERLCLDCHAMPVPPRLQQGRLEIEDAISCEGCHGPASGWLEGHRSEGWTHEQSVAAGMTDLRRPAVRAAVCLSCHLGAAGKTVDHDLIAAGHPELYFELDNFSEAMPAHWLRWAERADRATRPDTHGTPAWAVGEAESFSASLAQLARQARAAAEPAPAAAHWPEFSALACNGCHHSLAEQRWRSAHYAGRPGLPRWSPSRYATLRPLLAVVAPAEQAALDAEVERLGRQVARFDTPPGEVAASAERLARSAAALAPRLERTPWNEARVRQVLLALTGQASGAMGSSGATRPGGASAESGSSGAGSASEAMRPIGAGGASEASESPSESGREAGGGSAGSLALADYQSARQTALAVQTLVSQLLAADPRWVAAGLSGSAEAIAGAVQDPFTYDPARLALHLGELRLLLQAPP